MFVRIKRIKGQDYGYLVRTVWTGKGPRQKVSKYLGKLITPQKVRDTAFSDFLKQDALTFVGNNALKDIVEKLVMWELHKHGVEEEVHFESESWELKQGKKVKKNIVVATSEGFLCGASIKHIIAYNPDDDYTGFMLADRLTAAGIHIEKVSFVALFEKLQNKKVSEEEFYY